MMRTFAFAMSIALMACTGNGIEFAQNDVGTVCYLNVDESTLLVVASIDCLEASTLEVDYRCDAEVVDRRLVVTTSLTGVRLRGGISAACRTYDTICDAAGGFDEVESISFADEVGEVLRDSDELHCIDGGVASVLN